jgi:hypothetical protein
MPKLVERFSSPDGNRIALVLHETGEVWMMKRLEPADAAGTLAVLHRWEPIRRRTPTEEKETRRAS